MTNPRPGWRLYPRGFVGGIPATKMERMEPRETRIHHDQGRIVISQPGDNDLCVNDEVDELYASYVKNLPGVTTIDFRNQVLKAALHAFGSMSFYRWYCAQRASPGMGDLQYRFLADTLGYLQGQRRSMDMPMWEDLLTATQAVETSPAYVAASEKFFGVHPTMSKADRNDDLIDVIQMWCSRPNGIEDLLQSLHLLFGNP